MNKYQRFALVVSTVSLFFGLLGSEQASAFSMRYQNNGSWTNSAGLPNNPLWLHVPANASLVSNGKWDCDGEHVDRRANIPGYGHPVYVERFSNQQEPYVGVALLQSTGDYCRPHLIPVKAVEGGYQKDFFSEVKWVVNTVVNDYTANAVLMREGTACPAGYTLLGRNVSSGIEAAAPDLAYCQKTGVTDGSIIDLAVLKEGLGFVTSYFNQNLSLMNYMYWDAESSSVKTHLVYPGGDQLCWPWKPVTHFFQPIYLGVSPVSICSPAFPDQPSRFNISIPTDGTGAGRLAVDYSWAGPVGGVKTNPQLLTLDVNNLAKVKLEYEYLLSDTCDSSLPWSSATHKEQTAHAQLRILDLGNVGFDYENRVATMEPSPSERVISGLTAATNYCFRYRTVGYADQMNGRIVQNSPYTLGQLVDQELLYATEFANDWVYLAPTKASGVVVAPFRDSKLRVKVPGVSNPVKIAAEPTCTATSKIKTKVNGNPVCLATTNDATQDSKVRMEVGGVTYKLRKY